MPKRKKPLKGKLPKRPRRSPADEALERHHGAPVANRYWYRWQGGRWRRYTPKTAKSLRSFFVYRRDGKRIPDLRRFPFVDLSLPMQALQWRRAKRFAETKIRQYTVVWVRFLWEGQLYGDEVSTQWSLPQPITSWNGPEETSATQTWLRESKPVKRIAVDQMVSPKVLLIDIGWA